MSQRGYKLDRFANQNQSLRTTRVPSQQSQFTFDCNRRPCNLQPVNMLFHSIQWLQRKIRGRCQERPVDRSLIFQKLHPEVIIYMAEFLPLSFKALFMLTCRKARDTLGTSYWKILQNGDQHQQHVEFLSQLSEDLPPDYVPCHHCRILHRCKISQGYGPKPTKPLYQNDWTLFRRAESSGNISFWIGKDFKFRTFQVAMKQYRLGLDYETWLNFLIPRRKHTESHGTLHAKSKEPPGLSMGL